MSNVPARSKSLTLTVFITTFFVLTGIVVGLAAKPHQTVYEGHRLAAAHVTVHMPPPVHPQVVRIPVHRAVSRPVAPAPAVAAPKPAPGSVRARVLAAWPGDDRWVDLTVSCESGFDPKQIGGGGNNYYGLFQFGPWARSVYGNPLGMTVEQQTAAAWRLIKDHGSTQWACSPYWYHP